MEKVIETNGRLVVLAGGVIQQIVDDIPKGDVLGLPVVGSDRLFTSTPESVHEMVNTILKKEESHTSEVGPSEVFTKEDVQRALRQRREERIAALTTSELMWTEILAAKTSAHKLFASALKENQLDICYTDLKRAAELIKDGEIVDYFESPEVGFQEKADLLSIKLGNIHELVLELIYSLLSELKFKILADIAEEFSLCLSIRGNVALAEITTAIHLDDDDILHITKRLSDTLNKKVLPDKIIEDPSIIGGIIVRIGEKFIDGSVRTKLESMRKELMR